MAQACAARSGFQRAIRPGIGVVRPCPASARSTDAVDGASGVAPTAATRCPLHRSRTDWPAVATFLAAGAALAGLAVRGLRRRTQLGPAGPGNHLATLLLAVPVLAVSLWTAAHGSSAGRLAVVAPLYLIYNYAIFAFSVAMNPLTAVHIAIFGLALWSLLLAGRSAVEGAEAVTEHLNRRTAGGLLMGVGAMFGLLWLGQIAATADPGILPPDLLKAGISSNPVYALDLAFFLPLCAIAGIGLLRRNAAGAFAFPMLGVDPLMGAGIVGSVLMALTAESDGCACGGRHHRPRCHVLDPPAAGRPAPRSGPG